VGGSLDNLAIAHWGLGDYDTALALCERALAVKERALGPLHWEVGNTLNNLITVLAIQGETDEALDLALRAEEIGRERLRLTARSVSEREALGYASARVSGRDFALTFAAALSEPGPLFQVWDSEIRSRAIVLDEMGRRHQGALMSDAPEFATLRDELSAARTSLAELVVRGPERGGSEAYEQECEAARLEKERAERRLAAESAGFRSQLELEQAGLREVRDALPEGCALLAFSLYPHVGLYPNDHPVLSYMAFLLPVGAQDPMAIRLGPAVSIDPLVGLWKEQAARGLDGPGTLTGQETLYRRAGKALRQAIWDPIAEHVGDARQVFIVPDGAVNLVSFESLPVGEHEYLIEQDLRIHYLSAERDLLLSRREGPAGKGLLALGDPDFNAPPLPTIIAASPEPDLEYVDTTDVTRGRRSGRRDFDFMRFAPLPATGAELDDVAAVWRATSEDLFLRGAAAGEAALKAHAPGKRVMHLATHGFFLGEGHGNTENPLLLSGLVLAGANRRDEVPPGEDDGILTAEEVSALDLRGVEWAVLSACETGVGALEAGEGVLGLRRAFRVAGVGTVIMSLWEVEDEATREWMRALYKGRFEEHLSTAEAVRAAGLEVLNARRGRGETSRSSMPGEGGARAHTRSSGAPS
jgi:CHAT domain-containing protein